MMVLSYLFNLFLSYKYYQGKTGKAIAQQASTETFGKYWQAATAMVPETQVKEKGKDDYFFYVQHWERQLPPFRYNYWINVSETPEVDFSKNHLNITKFSFFIQPGDDFTKKLYGILNLSWDVTY